MRIAATTTGFTLALAGAALWVALPSAAFDTTPGAMVGHTEAATASVRRTQGNYDIPDVRLVRDDGRKVMLPTELNDGRPVVLNFIYTSCTSICPMNSQVFEQVQDELGAERGSVHLVSISIDPEQDTPARLRKYAAQFNARKGWDHYTASATDSVAVQRAFGAFRGDKMSHVPLTLMRAAPGQPWIRFDGFASASDVLGEREHWKAASTEIPKLNPGS
jgi:protein SCO1/2